MQNRFWLHFGPFPSCFRNFSTNLRKTWQLWKHDPNGSMFKQNRCWHELYIYSTHSRVDWLPTPSFFLHSLQKNTERYKPEGNGLPLTASLLAKRSPWAYFRWQLLLLFFQANARHAHTKLHHWQQDSGPSVVSWTPPGGAMSSTWAYSTPGKCKHLLLATVSTVAPEKGTTPCYGRASEMWQKHSFLSCAHRDLQSLVLV